MRSRRLALVAVLALLAYPAGPAPAQLAPRPAEPSGPTLRVGALLPLNGPGAWFGAEIKQGLELAAAELGPAPPRPAPTGEGATPDAAAPGSAGGKPGAGATAPPASTTAPAKPDAGVTTPPAPATALAAGAATPPASAAPAGESPAGAAETKPSPKAPAAESVEPPDRPRTVALAVQAHDVQPLDIRDAEAELAKLLGTGVSAVITASPTPTLAAYPVASARDVLVLHAGLANERFPATSRTLFQLRPSPGARAELLAAHAWERGLRRLAVLAGGDPAGRAMRAAIAARWQKLGGHLAHEESLSLDASDLRSRLRAVSRLGPDAVLLGFQGAPLGEAARALRDAGYGGQILAADDDRAARLAGGRALDGALLLSDAFVPVPGTRGARFARAYEAKHGSPPSRFAAVAYETAVLLVDAAQKSLGDGRGMGGTRLRDVLVTGRRFPSLFAGDVTVRDDGTVARPLALFRVDGAALVFMGYVDLDGRLIAVPSTSTP